MKHSDLAVESAHIPAGTSGTRCVSRTIGGVKITDIRISNSAALLSSITGDQAHQRFLAAPSDEDVQSLIWADCIAAAISAVIR